MCFNYYNQYRGNISYKFDAGNSETEVFDLEFKKSRRNVPKCNIRELLCDLCHWYVQYSNH